LVEGDAGVGGELSKEEILFNGSQVILPFCQSTMA